jgi:hypothetical protein
MVCLMIDCFDRSSSSRFFLSLFAPLPFFSLFPCSIAIATPHCDPGDP